MSENQEKVIEEYDCNCRIIQKQRNLTKEYCFEESQKQINSFENLPAARLYADIYTVADGLTEKQTGERGVPPAIARASEEIRMTYFAVQMSITYAARAFDVDESVVQDAINRIHAQAEEQRSQTEKDA
ncbi:hypothetical protein [Halosimplex pelagicum]|uniref:Uncharacterized protein n=1 Tax=Halosimplex pelagicum TaxID=869886 RepID=A0A7D5P909_9EURY|nr:hypothetical protein [Halosimplex pelagicum]QLH83786.1 hypothetical protein HZS54_20080 [Halosimplex pelagicum]